MANIKSVTVVSVPVSDQERAKTFYVNKLGFQLLRDDTSIAGMRWVQVGPRNATTSLTLVNWFDSMPAGSLQGLVLNSDTLEADYAELINKDVEFASPPEKQPYGTEVVFRDPDGNSIVLQQA